MAEDDPARAGEQRVDPADGHPYTREEFLKEYAGLNEWHAARHMRVQ
jgi:hypothetical protein